MAVTKPKDKRVVAVVVARAGSKGIPRKNLKPFCGKPLFYWSVKAALDCPEVDDVIVSTDCAEIQRLAVSFGARAPGLRPYDLASDTAQCIDAVHHAVSEWSPGASDVVVILQPTSPLRTAEDISNALSILSSNPTLDAVVSFNEASKHPLKMHRVENGTIAPFSQHAACDTTNRQELPLALAENGAVYAFRWDRHIAHKETNMRTCGIHAERIGPYMMPNDRSYDIDDLGDWERAEDAMLKTLPKPSFSLGGRPIGENAPPFVIAEIGINHEGSYEKAVQMVDDAKRSGCECVKFQSHICSDEMAKAAGEVIPGNATESILAIMERCTLSTAEDKRLKKYVEDQGMLFLSTPFSRAAADHLESLGVPGYKIGSGECNNYPLLKHVASFGKPIILSTGMNSLESVAKAVDIFETAGVPYALMHCTSMYPTPYNRVRLGCIEELRRNFPNAVLGLSDHSLGNWTCYGAVALGASILEKHYTSDKSWPGPDIPISIDTKELEELRIGSAAIWEAGGGKKEVLQEEHVTAAFAYASVVTIAPVQKGELFTRDNTWVKRPGTGELLAEEYENVLGKKATEQIDNDVLLCRKHIAW